MAGNTEYYRINNDDGLLLSRRYFNQRLSQATEDDRRGSRAQTLRRFELFEAATNNWTTTWEKKRRLHYPGRSEDSLKPNEIIDPIQLTGIKTIRFYASRNLAHQNEEIKKS